MNKEVSVTGMKLKATAEEGLVISDYTKTGWATSWTVTQASSALLAPTSTPALATPTFVRAESDLADDAKANQNTANYTALTLTYDGSPASGEGIGSASRDVQMGADNSQATSISSNYTLLRKFYIKGTGDSAWAQNLVIDEVSATIGDDQTAKALDNSLRVLVVAGTNAFIYAPFQDVGGGTTTDSYTWKGTDTSVNALAPTTDSTCSSITSIPAANGEPIEVSMYMYFEGEDVNCKSTNASGIALNDITVSAKFKTADVSQNNG